MRTKLLLSAMAFIILSTSVFAQKQLWLNDGKIIEIQDYKLEQDSNLVFYKKQNNKIKSVERPDVFMVLDSKGQETIFYQPDTLDNIFSANEMKNYVKGRNWARRNYKCPVLTITSFALGAATPIGVQAAGLNPLISPVMPLGETAVVSLINPKLDKYKQNNSDFENKHFNKGFEEQVKRKRINNTAISASIGMVLGIATVIIIGK